MLRLFCLIVKAVETPFCVDIDANESVGALMKTIKEEKGYNFPANELTLFVGKEEDGKKDDGAIDNEKDSAAKGRWLSDDCPAVRQLEEGKIHDNIKKVIDGESLRATKSLEYWLFEKSSIPPPSPTDQIHVLVVLSTRIPNALSAQRQDSSDEWLSDFLSNEAQFPTLPRVGSLKKFIEQALPVKIRIRSAVLESWSRVFLGGGTKEKLFTADDVAPCKKINKKLDINMLNPLQTGDSKNSFIWFWDTMIRAVLEFVLIRARCNRCSSNHS